MPASCRLGRRRDSTPTPTLRRVAPPRKSDRRTDSRPERDSIAGQLGPRGPVRQPAFGVAQAAGGARPASSPSWVGDDARSIGKLSGGSNGTAATPAIDSCTHSPTKTETASPSATGSMRRSHGALRVSSVRSSSKPGGPEQRTEPGVEDAARAARAAAGRISAAKVLTGNRVRLRIVVRRRERGEQRLVPQRVDANAVAARRGWRLHHGRSRQLVTRQPAAAAPASRPLRVETAARGARSRPRRRSASPAPG